MPNWHSQDFHIAYWNRFGYPAKAIREGFNFDTWWVDPAKAAALKRRSSSDASCALCVGRRA